MSAFIKDVAGNGDTGTAFKWGGNDIMIVDNMFNDIDISGSIVNGTGAIRINTPTRFRSTKLILRDSGNDHNYIFVTSNLAANRNITYPILTTDDIPMFNDHAATVKNKTFNTGNSFNDFVDIVGIAAPANPSAGTRRLFVDTGTNELSVRTSGGTTVSLETGGGGGAPTGAQYLVLSADGTLSAERVFTAGENVKVTDAGAGGAYTVEACTEDFVLGGVISPAQLTADTNNWNPTNLATSSIIRVDTDSSFRKLTGITAPSPETNKVLKLRNISANTLLLQNQNANSTAANRFDFNGYDIPLFPKQEITLMYDVTLDRWICEDYWSHVIPLTGYGYYYRNDMFTIAADGTVDWFANGTGAANSVSAITSLAGHPGVVQQQTGTQSSGTTNFQLVNDASILLGNNWYWSCEMMVRFTNLSDGTNTYGVDFGFIDNVDIGSPIDGVYAFYMHSTNSGNWVLACESNNTLTSNNSSSAVAAATWYKVKVVVYPNGTAELFINDVSVVTSDGTNVPTGAGRGTGFGSSIFKTVGSTSRSVDIDYIEVIGYGNVSR